MATPHSVHSFPQSRSTTFYNDQCRRQDSFDQGNDPNERYEFRDQERELYERQVEFERELDRERFVEIQITFPISINRFE